MKSLSQSGAQLIKATRELQIGWEVTAASWRDHARTDFERAYLDELLRAARSAAGAMDAVSALLREAITKCR